MDETAHTATNVLLIDRAFDEFTLNNRHLIVIRVERVGQSPTIGTFLRAVVCLALEIDLG